MMDLLFLVCWTCLFIAGGFFVWKRLVNRHRLYLMMLVNLLFLAGLFYLYPVVVGMMGNP